MYLRNLFVADFKNMQAVKNAMLSRNIRISIENSFIAIILRKMFLSHIKSK